MRYTVNDIRHPDQTLGIKSFGFSDDLRNVFNIDSNNDIGTILEERGVALTGQLDTESACTWAYFKTENEAKAFIKRLNQQPEVKAFRKPTKEICYVMTRKDYNKLRRFLNENLTKKQWKALHALDLKVIDHQEHWVA